MIDKKSSNFRFKLDDDTPDSYLQAEIQDNRVEKLSHRITLFSILIPLLLIGILALAYFDIQTRVLKTQNTGTEEVEKLSKNLESRFSSLSLKYAKHEETLSKLQESVTQKVLTMDELIEEFEKTNTQLKSDLKKTNTALSTLQTSTIDKKEVMQTIEKINETVAGLGKDLDAVRQTIKQFDNVLSHIKSLDNDIQSLDKKFTRDLVALSAAAEQNKKENKEMAQTVVSEIRKLENLVETTSSSTQDLVKLKAELSSLSSAKMDKQLGELILKKHNENLIYKMDQLEKKIDEKIKSIEIKMSELERVTKSSATNKTTPKTETTPDIKSTIKPAEKNEITTTGKILEQNIKK